MSVEKIGPQHRARKAVLYVRQSSVQPVLGSSGAAQSRESRGCSTPSAIVSCNSAGRKSR